MDASFIPIEVVPSKTPFGLDQLRRSYKTALSAEAAIAAAPAVGTADETFPNMFLMPISTPESAESATRIDLVYMGSLQGDEGEPVLPAQLHEFSSRVMSATSQSGPIGGFQLSSPVTLQFYAPTNTLRWISTSQQANAEAVDDPVGEPTVISLVFAPDAIPFGFTGDLFAFFRYHFFVTTITSEITSTEIVPGQFWLNQGSKSNSIIPFQYDTGTGASITLDDPGSGYVVGDNLTISSGGESADISVTAVTSGGAISLWAVSSNTFTVANSGLAATGGTGTGATFNVIIT